MPGTVCIAVCGVGVAAVSYCLNFGTCIIILPDMKEIRVDRNRIRNYNKEKLNFEVLDVKCGSNGEFNELNS